MDHGSFGKMYEAGDIIAGRYRVQRVLGIGGMGVVVAARHQDLDTLVAIKMLRPELLTNADVVARFAAEARAAVRIKSEHVARVTDVGTLPEGSPYMVMEYLEGTDLAELVKKNGKLPIHEAVDYVLQACEALAEAHSLGIVHRDLKPGNLFLCRRADGSELVKVLDFGISKTTGVGQNPSLTSTSALLGSPTYMSPEQLSSSKSVDSRTDIWALGIILHEILSGELPFRSDTLPELFIAIVQNQPPGLEGLRSDVPKGLADVVRHCLEKDRSRRFENVGQFAVALGAFAPQRSHISIERILRLVPAPSTSGGPSTSQDLSTSALARQTSPAVSNMETQGTWGQTASKPKRGAFKTLSFGAGALVLLAGGAFALRAMVSQQTAAAPSAQAAVGSAELASEPPLPSATSAIVPVVAAAAAPAPAPPEPSSSDRASPLKPPAAGRASGRVQHAGARRAAAPIVAQPPSSPVAPPAVARPVAVAAPTPAPTPTPQPAPKKNGNEWEEDRR